MCLGIPGEVIELHPEQPDLAKVNVSGVRRMINIGLLSDDPPAPGDWVLIHVGFALSKIDEQEAAAALESAYNSALQARANAKTQTSIMGQKSAVLDLLLMQEASYVQNSSGGDKAKIESAGFDVRDTPTPIGQLPPPAEPKAVPSQHPGTINLSWKKVRGAKSYLIERALDSNQPLEWAVATMSTKSKAVVNTMTSGLRYWFRVAAVGSAGPGAWSEPISKIVT